MGTLIKGLHAGSATDRVVQVLELEPERWWTLGQILAETSRRFPDLTEAAAERAFYRLITNGHVKARTIPQTWTKVYRTEQEVRLWAP